MVKKGEKRTNMCSGKRKPNIGVLERMEGAKDGFRGIFDTDLVQSLRTAWEMEKSGLGEDLDLYFKASTEAAQMVHDDPTVLDTYAINIDSNRDQRANMTDIFTPVENILYMRANPWLVATRIIGNDNLNRATALTSRFNHFTPFQKKFLRCCLDPRHHNIIFIACRAGAKTWLTALATLIMSYLMPSIRVMIVSGSQEQSDNLYKYIVDLAENTPYERMILGEMLKSRTTTIAGGWIRSFPASHKKVHGPRPDVVIVDEGCKADSDIIHASMSAALSAQDPKFVVMTTPDKMVHIVHDWWVEAEEQEQMTPVELATIPQVLRWTKFHIDAYHCPWITQDAIDVLIYKYGGKNTHEYKIFILGLFAPAEGLVFIEAEINASIIRELPETVLIDVEKDGEVLTVEQEATYSSYSIGLDVGGKHPTAIVTACEDQNGIVYIVGDLDLIRLCSDEKIIEATHGEALLHRGVVSADAAPIQYFINRKIRKRLQEDSLSLKIVSFQKNKGPMISVCKGLFNNGMVKILRKCERLINELLSYAYDDNPNNIMPAKGDDDHVDAFMLACWEHRNTFLNRRYSKNSGKVYNMEEHLEPIDAHVFPVPRIRLHNPNALNR